MLKRILVNNQRRVFSSSSTVKGSPIGWASLGISIGVGGLLVGYYLREKEDKRERMLQSGTKSIGKPLLGGPFTLVDDKGRIVTEKTLFNKESNKYGLLYFGFTHCPDICPSEMVKMTKVINVLDSLGKPYENRMLPIFITVDPRRDGVAQVGHYVKDFHPTTIGLTGTPKQIADVCKQYRVYHSPQETKNEDEEYLVDHSIVIYLISPTGEFLEFFTQLAEVPEIVERIKNKIDEETKQE